MEDEVKYCVDNCDTEKFSFISETNECLESCTSKMTLYVNDSISKCFDSNDTLIKEAEETEKVIECDDNNACKILDMCSDNTKLVYENYTCVSTDDKIDDKCKFVNNGNSKCTPADNCTKGMILNSSN